jgi:hypothetical protein
VRSFAEAPGAELFADGDEAQQTVLQPLTLLRGRGAAQYLQTLVDLDRVAGDGNGVLPVAAQALGERDRDARLPDRRRPEDPNQPGRL